MIARHRGDLRAHSRWRPSIPAPPLAPTPTDEDLLSSQHDEIREQQREPDLPVPGRRKPRALIAAATIVALAVIAGQQHSAPASAAPHLPATPEQWVDQWTAATLQNPGKVCGHLYAPALARAFKSDTGRTCTQYYRSVKSTSFRIRHVFRDGPTAVVEAREVGARRNWGYFAMLLSHVGGGWRAVDVVPGGSVRAR